MVSILGLSQGQSYVQKHLCTLAGMVAASDSTAAAKQQQQQLRQAVADGPFSHQQTISGSLCC